MKGGDKDKWLLGAAVQVSSCSCITHLDYFLSNLTASCLQM